VPLDLLKDQSSRLSDEDFMLTSPVMIEKPATSEAARDRAALGRIIALAVTALLAFALTACLWECVADGLHARPAIPEPFKTKIDLCLASGSYDTLFIGSSRFFHGVDPAVFDAETARGGLPTHSYDLGYDALSFYELRFVTLQVLADPRFHLKYLFIEPSLRIRLAPGLEQSQRAIVLHDINGSKEIFDLILRGNHDWKRKLFWTYEQAKVSAVRLTNVGALTNRFIRAQEPPPETSYLQGPAQNGYTPLDPNGPRGEQTTAADLARMISDQKTAEQTGTARELNAFEIGELTDLQTRAAARGVQLILLSPPTATPEMFSEFGAIARAHQTGQLDVPTLSFDDPAAYPDLYQPDGFVDPDHIGQPVSAKWSKHAADAFVDAMRPARK
jgi:hypothetical protein